MTLGVSLTALLIYFSANTLLFGRTHIHLNLFAPLLAYSLSSLFIWIRYMQTEGKILRERFYSFRRQLPDETAKALMEQPESLINERKIVTVMFTDIRGFSRMGEMLPPDQIIQILNEYMTVMTDIVFDNKGTLDKYIGDGLMAVYGNIGRNNPKEDAYCAVKTALEMQEAMVHLQRKWMDQGMRPIQIRIGINTGDALVGYVGHPERKEMTVIGDTVNTTARIEKLNKQYHSQILISHSTYQYVKDTMEVHPIGKEKLKGKSSSVMVYEVKGWLEAHTH